MRWFGWSVFSAIMVLLQWRYMEVDAFVLFEAKPSRKTRKPNYYQIPLLFKKSDRRIQPHKTTLSLSPQDGVDLLFPSRRSFLEQAAATIQGSYWSQFADETYTGKRGVMTEEKMDNQSIRTSRVEENDISSTTPSPPRPYAPVEALLPAIRVRTLLTSRQDKSLEEMSKTLSLDDLSSRSIRRAFNTYTANLRFGEAYTLNLTGQARKQMIRSNQLPDISTVITADLDLRDLQRNSILTLVQDLRAEVQYQLSLENQDRSEVDNLYKQLLEPLDTWFSFIDDADIQEATKVYQKRQQQE